jgi:hypothetical protein
MEITTNIDNIITYIEIRDAIVKAYSTETPEPFRLVMIKCKDFCQFCPNPDGDVYNHFISFDHHFGFLSCYNCLSKGKLAVTNWIENKAYGNANHLRNMEVKVRRTSGTVESDWQLNELNPFVENIEGTSCVHVVKSDKSINKWVNIDELIELNK